MSEQKLKQNPIAVILVRGTVRARQEIIDTLKMLRLKRKNSCVIVEPKPSVIGMIKKVKDYVTWGEIDNDTLKLLIEKRGKKDPFNPNKIKGVFRLNSPKKGYGRAGIKKGYKKSGALGYRGNKISDLIKRMI
ncbi:MAG: uL30 family ribosomal protein [Candidatus Woesearchaeota archaeon]|nr:uL30 family ribosomal protein [Candidatus Woesearchaeota archaeon]